MRFRAIIYSIDNSVDNVYINQKGNWFSFNGRLYRKCKEANRQVLDKSGKVSDLVEAVYQEGISNPIGATATEQDSSKQIFQEQVSLVAFNPKKGFLSRFFK
jgi:hypothetical protein